MSSVILNSAKRTPPFEKMKNYELGIDRVGQTNAVRPYTFKSRCYASRRALRAA